MAFRCTSVGDVVQGSPATQVATYCYLHRNYRQTHSRLKQTQTIINPMSKREYQLIASVIKGKAWMADADSIFEIADAMADALKADNERFDKDKFMVACGARD